MDQSAKRVAARAFWSVIVIGGSLPVGFGLGVAFGVWFVPVDESVSLDWSASVINCAKVGALIAAVLAVLAVWKASQRALKVIAAVLAACLGAYFAWLSWQRALYREQQRELGFYDPLPDFADFRIQAILTEDHPRRGFYEMDIDARYWSFRYVAGWVPAGEDCSGWLKAVEASALVAALAEIDKKGAQGTLCPPSEESTVMQLHYEGVDGDWSADIDIDCLDAEPGVHALNDALLLVPQNAIFDGRWNCTQEMNP